MSIRRYLRPQPLSFAFAFAVATTAAVAAPPVAPAPVQPGPALPKGTTLSLPSVRLPARFSPQQMVVDGTTYAEAFVINGFKPKDNVMTLKPSIGAPPVGPAPAPGGVPGMLTPPNVFIQGGSIDLSFAAGLGARYRVECKVTGPGRFIFTYGSRSTVVEASGGKVSALVEGLPVGPGKKVTLYGQSPDATMTREWTWSGCEINPG